MRHLGILLLALAAATFMACGGQTSGAAADADSLVASEPVDSATLANGTGDDEEKPVIKRRAEDEPADIKELARWLEVPYVEEDNVPRMGVTYKDTNLGIFKFRFYITGGKNGTDFGQTEWYIRLRTKGPIPYTLTSLGHSIYRLNADPSGALGGYVFVDRDGERIIVVDQSDGAEYAIVDEEPDQWD